MRTVRVVLLSTVLAFALCFLVSARSNFTAHLVGDQETPPVSTLATGQAFFSLGPGGSQMSYKLIVANIENVRAAHIHLAPAGVPGPVVVTLFGGPTIAGRFDGVLAEGNFSAANLSGPLAGMTLNDLLAEMENGNTYVNVHTDQYPGGEIRGQIR